MNLISCMFLGSLKVIENIFKLFFLPVIINIVWSQRLFYTNIRETEIFFGACIFLLAFSGLSSHLFEVTRQHTIICDLAVDVLAYALEGRQSLPSLLYKSIQKSFVAQRLGLGHAA